MIFLGSGQKVGDLCLFRMLSLAKRLTKWQEKPPCPLKPACRRQGGFKEKQLLVIELLVIGFFKCFND